MTFRNILLLLFFCLPIVATAQADYFNSDSFWGKLVVEPPNTIPKLRHTDTAIIIATNRKIDTCVHFCTESRAGGVRYYFVYSDASQWHLIPLNSFKKAIALMPNKNDDWVIYTEGMGKFFTTNLDRGMQVAAQYGVNVLMLDYPTLRSDRRQIRNYFFAMKNAKVADEDFAPLLDTIKLLRQKELMGNGQLNLFFHSMGNIVLMNMVNDGWMGKFNNKKWVDNLILNAPCVAQRNHKKWLAEIHFASHIYVHYNPHDFTLGGAYLMTKKNQLGMKVKRPISEQATYINFNTLVDKEHSYFVSLHGRTAIKPQAFRHYNILFHGRHVNVNDTNLYKPSTYKQIGYDILP